jgi:hypothetical protein
MNTYRRRTKLNRVRKLLDEMQIISIHDDGFFAKNYAFARQCAIEHRTKTKITWTTDETYDTPLFYSDPARRPAVTSLHRPVITKGSSSIYI